MNRVPGLIAVLLLLATRPALAGGIAALQASHDADQRLDDCLDDAYRPGVDRPDDGGRSRAHLLGACPDQWRVATETCHLVTGQQAETCRRRMAARADALLELKAAAIP